MKVGIRDTFPNIAEANNDNAITLIAQKLEILERKAECSFPNVLIGNYDIN